MVFPNAFPRIKYMVFFQNYTEWGRKSSIDNTSTLNQPLQAIIWACIDPDLCRHVAPWGQSGIIIQIYIKHE